MADSGKPTPSLMDRITTATPGAASSSSWADEVASPTGATPTAPTSSMNSLVAAQVDGAAPMENGSALQDGEYEVTVSLSALQNQQDNPLYSVASFEELGLSQDILQGIYGMNFKKPSRIQEKTLPLLLSAQPMNMIAQSQSGTGKTAAFVITVLSRIDRSKPKSPQALIIAPSRELARQIEGVVKSIGQAMPDLFVQAAVPGVMARGAPVQAAVVVGTPGTVMDLIKRKQFDTREMKLLVLDEADNMLDQQGLGDQCMRLKQMIPTLQQTLLFSATFPDHVMNYANTFAPQAHLIKLQRDQLTVSGIKQMYMDVSSEADRYGILASLYGMMTNSSSIIFVKKRETANSISQRLQAEGHTVVAVHGAFEGDERDRILKEFREGNIKVLITTNVLARGIDVSTVSMVINYDIPMKGRSDDEPDTETYLHRIGRTGRFGRVGVSISFVFDRKSYEALDYIAKHYNIDLVKLDQSDWDACEDTIKKIIRSSQSLVA